MMKASYPDLTRRRPSARHVICLLAALVLTLGLTACGGDGTAAQGEGGDGDLTKLTFLSPAPYGIIVPPMVVGTELGIFEDEGISGSELSRELGRSVAHLRDSSRRWRYATNDALSMLSCSTRFS